MPLVGGWLRIVWDWLNPTKMEFKLCSTWRRLHLIDDFNFILTDGAVPTSISVGNLSAFFDQALTFEDHVNRRIKSIRTALPKSTAIRFVNSFLLFHELIIATDFGQSPSKSYLTVCSWYSSFTVGALTIWVISCATRFTDCLSGNRLTSSAPFLSTRCNMD